MRCQCPNASYDHGANHCQRTAEHTVIRNSRTITVCGDCVLSFDVKVVVQPTIHPAVTLARIVNAVKRSMRDESYPGFCIACGRKAKQPCEPDAREYPCQYKSCGKLAVYGAEELLMMVQS